MVFDFTPDLFAMAFGALVSVAFAWIPHLRIWFTDLKEEYKQYVMLGFSALLVAFIAASSYFQFWSFVTWDKAGWLKLAEVWFMFLLANQSVYKLTPKAGDVKILKALQKNDGYPGVMGG